MILQYKRKIDRFIAVLLIAQCCIGFSGNLLAATNSNSPACNETDLYNQSVTAQVIKNARLPEIISMSQARSDINYLVRRLEVQSSYLLLRGFDYRQAFGCLDDSLEDPVNTLSFARSLQKIIMQIGDAHAKFKVELSADDDRYLPFIIADTAAGIVALKKGGKGFLNDDYPFIKTIDGWPLAQLMEITRKWVPAASPQLVRRGALRGLRAIDRLRTEQGIARSPLVSLVLQSPDASKTFETRLETRRKRLPGGKLSLGESRVLDGNIGYLRIGSMDNSKVEEVLSSMEVFQDTDGLVIDVRGNRGGQYGILRALYGYFIPDDSPPYVANIAAYRLSPRFKKDYLHKRRRFRMDHAEWTPAQRRAIIKSMTAFKPQWRLPEAQFSDWHFMLLGKSDDPRQYYYHKPVAVLSDAASFSATDVFLSAFADIPGLVLFGQASSGGSGATRYFTLPNSGVKILLSTLVSFRPNGKLLDGNGIEVDVEVAPKPADFLSDSDTALEEAHSWIIQNGEQQRSTANQIKS